MSDPQSWSFETRQIHAGTSPDPTTGARALPIYATTAYQFRDTQHAADLFALAELGNIYTRIMNPTQDALEQRVASLEGGVAALAVSSGQSATTLAILNLAEAGDHVVASASLYGGTYNLLHHSLPKLGITVSFVEDPDDPEAWQALVQDNTKAFFGETIGNPKGDILDIEAVAGGRAPQRRPADRRQHHRDAVPHPAVRVRRRHRRPLGHQVPGRPRHGHRRDHRRRRHVRLGRRQAPRLHHARPDVQRRRLQGPRRAGASRSRPACSCCATSARRSRRSTRSSSSRASRRCRCAWSGTSPTPSGWPSSSRRTTRSTR